MKSSIKYIKSKFPIQLFILLAVSGILNSRASIATADDLRAYPTTVVFNAVQGHPVSETRSVFIFTSLGTQINWTLTKDVSWLTPDIQNGVTEAVLKIGVNTAGRQPGIYNGSITIASAQSSTAPIIIEVSLVVNPDVPVIVTDWKDGKDGAMSVSVDDSRGSGYDALQANGLKGTYVLEGITPPSFYSTYYNAGMELGSHTVHHICSALSDDVLRTEELEPNISSLCSNTPQPCKDLITLVWPCGFTNYSEQSVAADYYLSARGYNINQLEDPNPENFMNLKSYNSHEHYPFPPSDLKTLVDAAVSQHKWFNLVLHDFNNDDGAINYAPTKSIWVASIGTIVKYILQRNRLILTNYNVSFDRITYNVSRLQIPSSVLKNFEPAFGSNDLITMQIDIDDSRIVENVFINGVSTAYQTKNVGGNIVLLTNVKLEPAVTKAIEIKYKFTTIGLTLTGVTANNKVYDRTTSATLNTGSAALVGVLNGDAVTLVTSGVTGTFVNKNAGTAKVVSTSGFTLVGTDAFKYTLTQPAATADITKANLAISGVTANNKVYNGTTTATLITGSAALVGVFSGDVVTVNSSGAIASFANKNVGAGKLVTASGFTIGGTDAGNYNLTQPALTADITTAVLMVSGVTANNKVYDGTTAAILNTGGAALTGVFGTDVVLLNSTVTSGTFANKNVGTSKVVSTSGFTLSGPDIANYTLTQPSPVANITKAGLTVSDVSANNKVYNGTTTATLNTGSATLVGVLGGDVVNLILTGATGTFVNKNVGTGKSVSTSGFTLGGADGANYNVAQPSSSADITIAGLTISGVTASNKVYDGTTTATLNTGSAALVGVFGSDAVTLISTGAAGTFADANIGTSKIVTTSGFTIGGTDAGNYSLTQPTATASITGILLTVTGVTANNKVYDGSTAAILNTGSAALVGVLTGNDVTLISTGAAGTFVNKNAGTGKTVSTSGFTLGGTDADKYTIIYPTAMANITKANLTVTGVTVNNKVYNGTTIATLNTGSTGFVGVFGTDVVSLVSSGATGTFVNKNVGNDKSVSTSGFTLGGADAVNYNLTQPATTGNITASGLTVSGVTANNKVYDGTTSATLNTGSATLAGVVSGDNVTLITSGATGTFANENVGTAKVVSTSGFALGGTESGNYALTQPTTTANITGIDLTVTGVTANSKVYDGTTAATLNSSGATILGVLGGDIVTLISTGATGTFVNKNVGINKVVTTSGFTLGGANAGKYSLTQPATTANITTSGLTVSGVTVNNKVYNGTTAATLNSGSATFVGVFGTDIVNLVSTGATGTFINKNVGIAKTVSTSGFTLGGADAVNYTLTQPVTTANITAAALTVSGVSANNKIYNGTTAATLNTGSASLAGVMPGDVVTLGSSGAIGSFSNKNAGTGKSVSITGFVIGGTDSGNYNLTQPTVIANITGAPLTLTGVTANNKTYNGTTATTLNSGGASLVGVLGGDIVSLVSAGATGTFVSKNVGTAIVVNASGFTLGAADGGNYILIQPATTGNITASGLTVSGVTANNKVYDGTTSAILNTGSSALVGVFGADNVNLISTGATGTFANENVGTAKLVSTSGFTLGGTDSGNYTLTQPTTTASITGVILTVIGVTANNKVYNGTTTATLNTGSAALAGILGGDIVILVSTGSTGVFVNKNAGTGKTVSTSGFALGGTDASKYTLTQPSASANITAANLTLSGVTANNKAYDGTTITSLNTGSAVLVGVLGGDAVTLVSSAATGTFVNKNVGSGKSVSTSGLTLGGVDAGNYTLTQPTTTANITAASLTVSGVTANNKVYNGTTTATLNIVSASLTGVFGTDVVNLSTAGVTGTFANENIGIAKVVSTSGFTLGGSDSGNYSLTQPVTTADITGVLLTVTGVTAYNKVYNGTTSAILNTGSAALVGALEGDVVTLVSSGATGTFVNKNAGTTKAVSTSGFTLGGADAVNYTLIQPTSSANIAKAGLTITGVTAINKVYDGTTAATLNSGRATLAGVFGVDVVNLVSVRAAGTFENKNARTAKVISTSGFSISGPDADNYTLTQPSLTSNITPKSLIIRANDQIKHYKTTLTFAGTEFTSEGLVIGDAVPILTISSPGTPESALVGKYDISISGGTDNNYSFTYVKGILAVGKSILKAVADNKTKVYGSENPVLSITYLGFVKNEDASVLDVLPVASTIAENASIPGTYAITLSGGTDNNYDLTLVNGSLEIIKAPLTITAEDKTKVYGEENPDLSITYSGFVLGQDQSVIDVLPVAETDANLNSDAGNYDINIYGAADSIYSFIFKKGTLTINKANQVITFDNIPSGLRITEDQQLNATASSGLEISFEVSNPEIATLNGNILTITKDGNLDIIAKQAGDNNWNEASDVTQSIVTLPTFDAISSLFTPNNDGMNDYWYIPDLEQYGKLQVTVYNRFGQTVYQSDGYKNNWDGTWNGYPLPSASYYYIIKSSIKGFIKGVVNIVR